MAETNNVQRFLDLIAKAEGGAYNNIVGGGTFSDFKAHPNVVGVRTKEGPSTAAGRYQITKSTYDDFARRLGISDFSPQSQDKIALAIIQSHGALEDVKAGNFKAAIDKLGGRWASLPSSPYSQPKRSWEWIEKELQQPLSGPSPALQFQATNPSGITPTSSPGQPQLLMQDLQKETQYGGVWNTITQVPTAIQYGFQNENNAYNWLTEMGSGKADPNFMMTKEKLQEASKGLPEEYKGYLASAISDDDLARRISRLGDAVKRQQEMANMGTGLSFLGSAVGSVFDIDSLLGFIPVAGEVAAANKASRLARAVRAGLAAGAVNAGSEFMFGQYRPTAEDSDVYLAGLFGLAMGGAGGALAGGRKIDPDIERSTRDMSRWAQIEANKVQAKELEDAGLTLTDKGKSVFQQKLEKDFDALRADTKDKLQKVFDDVNMDILDVGRRGTGGSSPTTPAKTIDNAVSDAGKAVDDVVQKIRDEDAQIPTFTARNRSEVPDQVRGKETTVSSLLKNLVSNEDPMIATLANRLLSQIRDDVKVVWRTNIKRSFYDPVKHEVHLEKNAEDWVQLHEIAHAVTANKIRFGRKNPNTAHGQLTRELEGILAEVKKVARKETFTDHKTNYYLKNIDEFMAGIYSGKSEFIEFLQRTQIKSGSSALSAIVDAIRKLLGMEPNEVNALTKSLGAIDRLIDEPLKVDQTIRLRDGSDRNIKYLMEPGTDLSKTAIVGEDGKPMVVYHGTNKTFTDFEVVQQGELGYGFYFTSDPDQAVKWGSRKNSSEQNGWKTSMDGVNVRPVYLDIRNPADYRDVKAAEKSLAAVKDDWTIEELTDQLKAKGYDGVWDASNDEIVAFDKSQIKPAYASSDELEDVDLLPAPGSVPEGYWQGPSYENFFNRPWVPDEVKSFVRNIFGSTTGYKDHSVVAPAASDQKKALHGMWANQFGKTLQPAIQDYLERNPVPFMKRSEALEKWNEQLGDYIRGVPGNYDASIMKVGDEWRRLSKDVVDHINNPGKFNGDVKQGLTQREIIDDTGQKVLSDPLDYNANYLPRIPDSYKIANLISQYGRDTVEDFVGNMFRAANNKIDPALAKKLGTWYLKTIEEAKVNRSSELVDNLLRGFDRVSFKDSLIKIGGLNPNDADRIIASMSKPAKGSDSGTFNGSLKRRSVLDETYTQTVLDRNGNSIQLSYKDLFDTDTVGLINQYFNKQAGAISFANHTGVYSIQSAKQIIAEITARDFGSTLTTEQLTKMRGHLVDIVDMHLGRPLENFSTWNKALQMVADYNVLTKAGMFVLNQITEMSQLLGSSMRRSVLRAVPELDTLIRDTKTGKVVNEVVDSLENLGAGPGTQLLTNNPLSPSRTWVREKGDTPFNRWLDKLDNGLKGGVQNLFKFTGMTGVTMMQQRTFAVAMVNHFVDHAVNGKKLDISPERLAWMGLDVQDTADVFAKIRQYHTTGNSRLGNVDFKQWSQDDPKTFSKFIVAYQRESARVIQENDLASMVPIMGKQVGKMLFQFMGFPLQAWNKSMLFAVNHRDMQTLHTVMWAVGFNMLMYTARTQAQMVGMSAEDKQKMAEERLSSSQIMLNAIGRIPQLSILPNMFDTVSPVPLFSGMRTSTDLTDFVSGNPTLNTISSALSMSKKLARNAGSEDYQTTERDVKAMFRLVPLNNMIGVSNIVNSVASEFPSRELVDD